MPIISIFDNIATVRNPENIELVEYLEKTRDGEWEDIVNKCRLIKDKDAQKKFKDTMPTATLSGEFTYRNEGGMKEHSGILALDLDDVPKIQEVKKQLEKDRYVYSVFVSAGGYGLRVLFFVEPKEHTRAFIGLREYLFDKYDIVCIDPNGRNVSKPYIVSYDPFLYINYEDTPVFKRYIKETPIKVVQDFVHTDADFKEVLGNICGRNINICESYNDWLKVGFAISEKFGEGGRQYFHDVSRHSAKYNTSVTDRQYTSCLKSRGTDKPVNISTFYYLAKSAGVNTVTENTKKIVRTARNGIKSGLKKEQIIANLLKFENIGNAEEIVDEIYQQKEDYNEEEESILHALEMYISNNYSLKMNEVTGYLEQHGYAMTPAHLNTVFIAAKKILPKLDYPLMMRLLKSEFIETYNPFFKFFGSDGIPVELPAIPKKDQPEYLSPIIDKLASCIENDNPAFTLFFLRKWLVSIVSAAHRVHSPLLLALLGAQNSGKTEFFRRLMPRELKMYYAESKLDKEKDDELLMTENLIIMDDELGGKTKQQSKNLNNITSKQYYYIRRPYGDHNEKILRLGVLCGTSNYPADLLTDPTGNRRVIPIDVVDINKELYNSIDKKELFLEMFALYKAGFDWRVTATDIPYLNKDSEKYTTATKEDELLLKYFGIGDDFKMSTSEIIVELEYLTRQKLSLHLLGTSLNKLGFQKRTVRLNAVQTLKKWCVNKNFKPIKEQEDDRVPF